MEQKVLKDLYRMIAVRPASLEEVENTYAEAVKLMTTFTNYLQAEERKNILIIANGKLVERNLPPDSIGGAVAREYMYELQEAINDREI